MKLNDLIAKESKRLKQDLPQRIEQKDNAEQKPQTEVEDKPKPRNKRPWLCEDTEPAHITFEPETVQNVCQEPSNEHGINQSKSEANVGPSKANASELEQVYFRPLIQSQIAEEISKKDVLNNTNAIKSKKVLKSTQSHSNQLNPTQTNLNELKPTQSHSKGTQTNSTNGDLLTLHFFVQNELENGVGQYQYEEVAKAINKSRRAAENAVFRLVVKAFLIRLTSSHVGRGGGFIVKVSELGMETWRKNEQLAWIVAKSKKVLKPTQTNSIDKIRLDKNLILSAIDPNWWTLRWDLVQFGGVGLFNEDEVHGLVLEIVEANKSRNSMQQITQQNVVDSIHIFAERCKDGNYVKRLKSPMAIFKKEVLESASGMIKINGEIATTLSEQRKKEQRQEQAIKIAQDITL